MAPVPMTAETTMSDTNVPGSDFLRGVLGMPFTRQIILLFALAASVAAGISAVAWMMDPPMRPLTGTLAPQQLAQVIEALDSQGIEYELDARSGMVLVLQSELHEARMQIAGTEGVDGRQLGYELLDKEQGFGVSQFMEVAQHRRSLEGELAKSIASVDSVQSARILLAVPRSTAFVRDRRKATAAVTLVLVPGQQLSSAQVRGITNLVAGAVPELNSADVTIVDQSGRLLSRQEDDVSYERSTRQLEYVSRFEQILRRKVDNILLPSIGLEGFSAEVTAELDFTQVEQTEELFNPDLAAVRSEASLREESNDAQQPAEGVPGALANTPPVNADGEVTPQQEEDSTNTSRSRTEVTKNYEVDRTISHTQHAVGVLRRLTVSVVVDDMRSTDAETGDVTNTPWVAEDLERLQAMVQNAVGYSAERGDQVSIINRPFLNTEQQVVAEIPFWTEAWFSLLLKQVFGGLALILIIMGLLRPLYRNLSQAGAVVKEQHSLALAQQAQMAQALPAGDSIAASGNSGGSANAEGGLLPPGNQYSNKVEAVKGLIEEDPERVAQVVKNWVAVDE